MPCAACYGTCVVCQGLVPHGPTELPPGDSEAELRQEREVAARAVDEPQRSGLGPPVHTVQPAAYPPAVAVEVEEHTEERPSRRRRRFLRWM